MRHGEAEAVRIGLAVVSLPNEIAQLVCRIRFVRANRGDTSDVPDITRLALSNNSGGSWSFDRQRRGSSSGRRPIRKTQRISRLTWRSPLARNLRREQVVRLTA